MNKILTTTLYIMFFTTIIFSYVGSSAQTAWNLNGNTTIETSSIGILNNRTHYLLLLKQNNQIKNAKAFEIIQH